MITAPINMIGPACFGVMCERHKDCQRYYMVEGRPEQTIGTCAEPDGSRPLFVEAKRSSQMTRTSTTSLAAAMQALARDIDSPDGLTNAAIQEAAERLLELHRLIHQIEPIVQAQHGAEHMMDGFRKVSRPEIDGLLDAVLKEFC